MHTSNSPTQPQLSPEEELAQIHARWRAMPGRATGEWKRQNMPAYSEGPNLYSTGLASNDSAGYMQLLAEQRRESELRYGKPVQYRYNPSEPDVESAQSKESPWMREQGRNDRRRQLVSLDALRAAGNLPSRT
mgnify:FL=1